MPVTYDRRPSSDVAISRHAIRQSVVNEASLNSEFPEDNPPHPKKNGKKVDAVYNGELIGEDDHRVAVRIEMCGFLLSPLPRHHLAYGGQPAPAQRCQPSGWAHRTVCFDRWSFVSGRLKNMCCLEASRR